MSAPAVSVVITCFNYARWLPESVGSVLAQTRGDFELVIVDDGSTDDSLAVARELAAQDNRVVVLTQPNSGQPAIPRNRAIERARGRYIVSLDADDRLGETVLERSAAELDADPGAGLAYAQLEEFGSSSALHPLHGWSLERLKRFNFIPSATMFRRSAWAAAGGYNTNVRGYEDWDLWLGIAEAGLHGRPVPGARFHYRTHAGGVYLQTKGVDLERKAQVIVNRPGMFGDALLGWARDVLAGDADALALPQHVGIMPELREPVRAPRIARDASERADWYVDADGLTGPWPQRSLAQSLALVDSLGYTVVRAGGAVVARKRASDPTCFPVPFFLEASTAQERAGALAGALEDLVVFHALRRGAPLDAGCLARCLAIAPAQAAPLVSEAQALMRDRAPVPVARAAQLGRLAGLLRSELALAGDEGGAGRAAELERAAARAGLEGAKRNAVLAFADELVATPALLEAYGGAVSAGDDVTLVIVTGDPQPLIEAVAAAGLDGDGTADLIAVSDPPPGVVAVLSHREHRGLPRFDETSIDSLRSLLVA